MKENKEVNNPQKQPLSAEQKQRQKKMLVFPLMFLVFGLCLWLIFAPTKSDKEKVHTGFNTNIPMPKKNVLVNDKKEAYEQAKVEDKKQEQMHSLQDLASMFSSEMKSSDSFKSESETRNPIRITGSRQPIATIRSSNSAYKEINRNLGSFFDSPKTDTDKEKLNQKVEELSEKIQENENRKNTVAEQLELMEKSYQMAAKYMPQSQSQNGIPLLEGQNTKSGTNPDAVSSVYSRDPTKKIQVSAVNPVVERIVSFLPQTADDSVVTNKYKQPLNREFNTAVGSVSKTAKNTITACIHENCTLVNGQSVRLRLLEPLLAGTTLIPRNSIVSGEVKIQGDRLSISIHSLEFQEAIIPVELTVYDTDGQKGIYIPGSMEMNALKEMAANIGSNLGSSISITQSAGQQIASDLGKGVIQSGSQYLSKKFQQIKVKLKSGYKVLLLPDQE
ncbi:MAG: conjugative transposon protein TraM [Paludibacter sp.]|nr:conjugative transposon protein TraM [Paludibacter sp.]